MSELYVRHHGIALQCIAHLAYLNANVPPLKVCLHLAKCFVQLFGLPIQILGFLLKQRVKNRSINYHDPTASSEAVRLHCGRTVLYGSTMTCSRILIYGSTMSCTLILVNAKFQSFIMLWYVYVHSSAEPRCHLLDATSGERFI